MSLKQIIEDAVREAVEETFSEEDINESFEEAVLKGQVTDSLGEPITEFISTDVKTHVGFYLAQTTLLNQISVLKGKILTIIDATYEAERAKYVKDLVKGELCSFADRMVEFASMGHSILQEERDTVSKEEIVAISVGMDKLHTVNDTGEIKTVERTN